ncbi:MAG: PASTA domain-containing protein [Clostridia bacterium]|nr:PASTA domain-containing protein [Clostridia bacterium]
MNTAKNTRSAGATARTMVIRGKWALVFIFAAMLALCVRFAYLQLYDPGNYRVAALNQYTSSVTIDARRGTIYASDGTTALAVSATVYNCFISPYDIFDSSEDNAEINALINKIADGLSGILSVDRNEIISKAGKTTSKYQMIKKYLSDSEEAAIREYIKENDYEQIIHLEETTKRVYRAGSFAAHVIGFSGSDNQGLSGIEYTYDRYLRGTPGRHMRATDAYGKDLETGVKSTYIPAQNGLNVVTTIDWKIQDTVEKCIRMAYEENKPNGRVTAIVMDVNNGEILAMGIYPSFDLNNYNKLSDEYQKKYDTFIGTEEERAAYKTNLLYEMWNNTAVSQTYEPGSTFKIITSAMALEEGAITLDTHFNCRGSVSIGGTVIHCHNIYGHGDQTFPEALVNSCNPAFIKIGEAVGYKNFNKYFEEFGYNKTSGSDIMGEASSIYYGTTGIYFGAVELAAYSFGQTFKVTPIQHIRAVSAVANGGDLVVPHVVKALVDDQGNVVKSFDYEPDRQVISKKTSDTICEILTDSTKNASVSGYHIISKTGTSEKRDTKREDDYISSCVSFAPAADPRIAVLVTVDDPTAGQYFGSAVAAPVVANILTEVLPHMGITPSGDSEKQSIKLEDYRNSKTEDAKTAIESLGLKCVVKGNGKRVTEQMPRFDTVINGEGVVVLYTDNSEVKPDVKVPNLINSSPNAAIKSLINSNLNVTVTGIFNGDYRNCKVVSQSVPAGSYVTPGTTVELVFRYEEAIE